MGVLITLTGVPAYFYGVKWEKKPAWFIRCLGKKRVAFLFVIILFLIFPCCKKRIKYLLE